MTDDITSASMDALQDTKRMTEPQTILDVLDKVENLQWNHEILHEANGAYERRVAALEEGLLEACRAECGPWFDEGSEKGKLDPAELADRIIARALLRQRGER